MQNLQGKNTVGTSKQELITILKFFFPNMTHEWSQLNNTKGKCHKVEFKMTR